MQDDEKQRPFVAISFSMNRASLARTLAQSLSLGAWTPAQVELCLNRRLPARAHRLVPRLRDEVLVLAPGSYSPAVPTITKALSGSRGFSLLYQYCRHHDVWPVPDLTAPKMMPLPSFAELDLPQLDTVGALADWLLLSPERLAFLADATGRYAAHADPAVNHYRYGLRRKSGKGLRLIEGPKSGLKAVQRQILHHLIDHLPNHPDAFGFVGGRSCLDAAARHVGEDVVVCFDLQDFFPNIQYGRVFGRFRCMGYPQAVASLLTALCTTVTPARVLDHLPHHQRQILRMPHLPQGAPTSPALANHVTYRLDRRLAGLAQSCGARYSRYADDLAFSGDRNVARFLTTAVDRIVRDEGFCVNPAKTRVMLRNTRQTVTGVVVNQHLNVSRPHYDHLKAVIHRLRSTNDPRRQDRHFCTSLLGQIAWVEAVHPRRGRKLRDLLADALHA